MRPRELCTKLNEFFAAGLGEGVFLSIQNHQLNGPSEGESLAPSQSIGMLSPGGVTFSEYVQLVDGSQYSAILSDYAIISIECLFDKGRIVKHRYGYIPCPVKPRLSVDCPPGVPVSDWLKEVVNAWGIDAFVSLGTYRFDYAPKQKATDHPASHFTFASADCRIPVRAPLAISGFLDFLFDNFYRQYSGFWRDYSPFLNCIGVDECIELDELVRHHISWNMEM